MKPQYLEWINVKDQLPDLPDHHTGRVLTCDKYGFVTEGNYLNDGFYDFVDDDWVINNDITHWMELPKAPNR
jgi:hypothetical protein